MDISHTSSELQQLDDWYDFAEIFDDDSEMMLYALIEIGGYTNRPVRDIRRQVEHAVYRSVSKYVDIVLSSDANYVKRWKILFRARRGNDVSLLDFM